MLGAGEIIGKNNNHIHLSYIFRVPTHPGKREIPWNIVMHVPGREMSLKIKKIVKIRDLPWKSLLKA